MAIVQCPNNHYYDDKCNSFCPYCEKLSLSSEPDTSFNEQKTSYIEIGAEDDAQLTEAYGENVTEFERTIGIFTDESKNTLTVGWLVCVEGVEKGKSYTVHAGRNFAGRSFDMDIVISDDAHISRENHFSIVYDPKSVTFYLVHGGGDTYVNDKNVSDAAIITDGDVICVGQSKFIFVQFCKEGRAWD